MWPMQFMSKALRRISFVIARRSRLGSGTAFFANVAGAFVLVVVSSAVQRRELPFPLPLSSGRSTDAWSRAPQAHPPTAAQTRPTFTDKLHPGNLQGSHYSGQTLDDPAYGTVARFHALDRWK